MNVLIHTWWFSKYKGSEFSVAYNFVLEMSKYHKLYVIVESTSYALNDIKELESYQLQNCQFITVKSNMVMTIIYKIQEWLQKKSRILSFVGAYLYLNLWERALYKQLKSDTDLLKKIDIIHFLGPVGYHEPGYLYKLKKKYIWGPIGGFENVNKQLLSHYSSRKRNIKIKGLINNIIINTSFRVKKIMNTADVVIACTNSNKDLIDHKFKCKKLIYFPENMMRIYQRDIMLKTEVEKKYVDIELLNVIWCGNLVPSKMLNLLIDILKKTNRTKINMTIVGGGDDAALLTELHLNNVHHVGHIPRTEVEKYWKSSHLHILTSSYEANTTVMFEAMEYCVPTIAIDICGMTDLIENNIDGIKIPVSDYNVMCENFANHIDMLSSNPKQLMNMALNLREKSFNYTIDIKDNFYNNLYNSIATN